GGLGRQGADSADTGRQGGHHVARGRAHPGRRRNQMTDARPLLYTALDQAAMVVAGIGEDQAELPTPCAEWDVQGLVRPLVGLALPHFVTFAHGQMPDWSAPPAELTGSWSAAFDQGAQLLREAWRDADLDRTVPSMAGQAPLGGQLDMQIAELA